MESKNCINRFRYTYIHSAIIIVGLIISFLHLQAEVDFCSGNQGHGPCQQICTNTAGSFNCSCYPGYNRSQYICNGESNAEIYRNMWAGMEDFHIKILNAVFLCKMECSNTDINECLPNGGLGTCQQNCTNTNGSYYCSCKPGYVLSTDGSNCSDEYPVGGGGGFRPLQGMPNKA